MGYKVNMFELVKLEFTNLLKLGTISYFTNEQFQLSHLLDFLLAQDCELEEGLIPPYNCPGIYQVGAYMMMRMMLHNNFQYTYDSMLIQF